MTSSLMIRARDSGLIAPTLLHNDVIDQADNFETIAINALDVSGPGGKGFSLRTEISAAEEFASLLKMVGTKKGVELNEQTQHILERRRSILLTIVGATPPDNAALKKILSSGFLLELKSWLEDILDKTVGGNDLLLHLLSNITYLPVTKEMVSTSKMGRAIGSVEKHEICASGPNERSIKERIAKVKEEWSASVKSSNSNSSSKRARDKDPSKSLTIAKKAKSDGKKTMLTSDLLRKSGSGEVTKAVLGEDGKPLSAAEAARKRAQDRKAKEQARIASLNTNSAEGKGNQSSSNEIPGQAGSTNSDAQKKKTKHVAWADEDEILKSSPTDDLSASQALKTIEKTETDDKQVKLDAMGTTNPPLVAWRIPESLAANPDNPPVQVISNEVPIQVARMSKVRPISYLSEEDAPSNPTPLSDIEQALEMTKGTVVQATIPFFPPQPETATAVPATAAIPVQQHSAPVSVAATQVVPPPPAFVASNIQGATPEVVQAMGLPLFLAGSNIQALQTLASTPSLLSTFLDSQGNYDQIRLMNLVQTLSQSLNPTPNLNQSHLINQPHQMNQQPSLVVNPMQGVAGAGFHPTGPPPPPPPFQQPQQTPYSSMPQSSTYGNQRSPQSRQQFGKGGGYRGNQNAGEGNLHLSGYGPSTTKEEITALFAPYVQVVEVVPKGSFSFVNTNDPAGAQRAREALTGALLGGRPVRINLATRKPHDPSRHDQKTPKVGRNIREEAMSLPKTPLGQFDVDQARDDRGNSATKNLFVAGYGPGTTEQELRAIFGQHAQVTGAVMKGSFAFVNTISREIAVKAREALTGSVINGGVLRINFAKESGRLGTSFDQTYNASSYGPSHQQRTFVNNM